MCHMFYIASLYTSIKLKCINHHRFASLLSYAFMTKIFVEDFFTLSINNSAGIIFIHTSTLMHKIYSSVFYL